VWVFIMGGGGGDLIGNPQAPYANHLASSFGYASDVYAAGHPSRTNHLAVISGSTFGCGSESCPLVRTETLVGQVQRSGIPWAASGTVVVSSSGQHNEYWQNEFVT